MAVTVEQIKAEFPEFAKTSTTLISAKLADAVNQLSATEWRTQYDQAVKYMTCHLIALSPTGEFARLKPRDAEVDGATTIYERRLNQLKRGVLIGVCAAGEPADYCGGVVV